MSNPGPASTQSIHPQGLLTNQALRLIAVGKAVSTAVLGDTAIQTIDVSNFIPVTVVVANANNAGANVDVSSVNLGVYTAVSKGGNAILTAAALTSQTTAAYATVSASSTPNTTETVQTLYVNISSATATATVDVYVYGYDLSSYPLTNPVGA